MNFFLCNRCNKKSEDNLLNINSTEILLNNNRPSIINNNIMNKLDSIEPFPNINIGENIQTSINNVNDLEKENDYDELEIIEYPYSKKEIKKPDTKIKPKLFTNNTSKFNSKNLEQNILKHLNISGNNKKITYRKNNIKTKISDNNIKEYELERKDTMTDPAHVALSSLIQDINKKNLNINKNIKKIIKNNNDTDDEDDILTIKDDTENNYFIIKKDDNIIDIINTSQNNKEIKNNKISSKTNNKIKNNFITKDIEKKKMNDRKTKKSINNNNKNVKNKISQRKFSQNKKISEYNSSIIRKKNLLKNTAIYINKNNDNNLKMNLLTCSTKKQFPKSLSFNYFKNERKFNEINSNKKGMNTNELGNSLTLNKKYTNLFKNVFKSKDNEGILSSKKTEKNKNNIKITHKKYNRCQIPIQKSLSSQIASYH